MQDSSHAQNPVRANGDRPVRGKSSGTISVNTATGALTGEESGVISHLGKQTLHLQGVGTLSGDGTFTSSGKVTIIAANGDQLTGTFALSGQEPTLTGDVTITGGTGRFEHATGTLTVICVTSGDPTQEEQMVVIENDCTTQGGISY